MTSTVKVVPKDAKMCLTCRVHPVAGGASHGRKFHQFCEALFCSRACETRWLTSALKEAAIPRVLIGSWEDIENHAALHYQGTQPNRKFELKPASSREKDNGTDYQPT